MVALSFFPMTQSETTVPARLSAVQAPSAQGPKPPGLLAVQQVGSKVGSTQSPSRSRAGNPMSPMKM